MLPYPILKYSTPCTSYDVIWSPYFYSEHVEHIDIYDMGWGLLDICLDHPNDRLPISACNTGLHNSSYSCRTRSYVASAASLVTIKSWRIHFGRTNTWNNEIWVLRSITYQFVYCVTFWQHKSRTINDQLFKLKYTVVRIQIVGRTQPIVTLQTRIRRKDGTENFGAFVFVLDLA